MANLVMPARFLRQLSVLATLLLSAPSLAAAEGHAKLLAMSVGPRATSRATAAQRAAAKQSPAKTAQPAPAASPAQPARAVAPGPERQSFSLDAPWCQINGDRVNVRTGPGTQHQILTMLNGGDYVKARAVRDGWVEVDWPQNVPAWIGKEFVQPANGSSAATTLSARVYSAGEVRSTTVAKLDPGARVAIVGEEGNWYKIKAPESAAAYVSAKYVLTGVVPPPTPRTSAPAAAAAPTPSPALPGPQAPAPQPVSVLAPAPDSSNQTREDLLAAIEETRRELKASALRMAMPPAPDVEPAETSGLVKAAKEGTEELESARIAAENKLAARAEEQARREAEVRRLQECETALRAEAAAKAELEEQAALQAAKAAPQLPAAALQLTPNLPRDGAFIDPAQLAPSDSQPTGPALPLAALPTPAAPLGSRGAELETPDAPAADAVLTPAQPAAGLSPDVPAPLDENEAALLAARSQTLKRVQWKFIVPTQAPTPVQTSASAESRAQVVKCDEENAPALRLPEVSTPFVDPEDAGLERPAQVLRITAPCPAPGPLVPELPTPAGEPPPSLRLKPFFETHVRGAESAANVVSAEGIVERRSPSPVAGVEYALVRDGQTLHFLTAHADVNLEGLVGRRVSVTGVPLPSAASEAPVLEVGTVSITE